MIMNYRLHSFAGTQIQLSLETYVIIITNFGLFTYVAIPHSISEASYLSPKIVIYLLVTTEFSFGIEQFIFDFGFSRPNKLKYAAHLPQTKNRKIGTKNQVSYKLREFVLGVVRALSSFSLEFVARTQNIKLFLRKHGLFLNRKFIFIKKAY